MYVCVCVYAQSCPTVAQNCSLPGSSVHGIFQARIPEWVAISYPRGSSQPRGQAHISCASCIGRQIPYHLCHRCLVYAKHCGPGIASHSPLIRPLGACGISLFYSPSGPEKMSDLSQVTQQLSVRKIEINKCMSHSLPEEPESVWQQGCTVRRPSGYRRAGGVGATFLLTSV